MIRAYQGPSEFAFAGNDSPFEVASSSEFPNIYTKEHENNIDEDTCKTNVRDSLGINIQQTYGYLSLALR